MDIPCFFENNGVPSENDKIRIVCMDEDLLIDDLVGETTLTLSQIISGDDNRQWIELMYKGKRAAEISMEAKLVKPSVMKLINEKRLS